MARIAIDFDDTLISYNEMGQPIAIEGGRQTCKTLRAEGHKIIIFTCRIEIALKNGTLDREIEWIEDVLETFNIPYDQIYVGGKVIADLYVDDRNIAFEGNWNNTLDQIKSRLSS